MGKKAPGQYGLHQSKSSTRPAIMAEYLSPESALLAGRVLDFDWCNPYWPGAFFSSISAVSISFTSPAANSATMSFRRLHVEHSSMFPSFFIFLQSELHSSNIG